MNGRTIALIAAAILGFGMLANSSHSSSHTDTSWLQNQIDALKLKVKKVEALVTLMKDEKPAVAETSEPLREGHLTVPQVPIVNTSTQVTGMEPAKQPTVSTPVVTIPQAAAVGHLEQRGIRGRRSVWVSGPVAHQQPPAYQQTYQASQRNGVPILRRFGACRGGAYGS